MHYHDQIKHYLQVYFDEYCRKTKICIIWTQTSLRQHLADPMGPNKVVRLHVLPFSPHIVWFLGITKFKRHLDIKTWQSVQIENDKSIDEVRFALNVFLFWFLTWIVISKRNSKSSNNLILSVCHWQQLIFNMQSVDAAKTSAFSPVNTNSHKKKNITPKMRQSTGELQTQLVHFRSCWKDQW